MKCPKCGADNPEITEFCGLCMTSFVSSKLGKEDEEPQQAKL